MQQPGPSVSNENRLLAALGYPIGIIAIVILLTDMKNNRFMKYHAVQALFFIVALIIVDIALSIVTSIAWPLGFLFPLFSLAWFALSIYYAVQAYNGKMFSIPVVGQYAAKYAGGA